MITNNSDMPLRFLCMSTMLEPEVVRYPDSGKIGVIAGSAPGGHREKRSVHAFFPEESDVDYRHAEKCAEPANAQLSIDLFARLNQSIRRHGELKEVFDSN